MYRARISRVDGGTLTTGEKQREMTHTILEHASTWLGYVLDREAENLMDGEGMRFNVLIRKEK